MCRQEETLTGPAVGRLELVIAIDDTRAAGVELDVWGIPAASLFGLWVKERHPSKDTVLGPVADNISNSIGVYIVSQATMMAEQRRPRGNVGPDCSMGVLIPLVDAHNITHVHTQSELKEYGSNLMHCHSNKLDETNIE